MGALGEEEEQRFPWAPAGAELSEDDLALAKSLGMSDEDLEEYSRLRAPSPTPHTLHPTPYTPHPTPHTPHPTSYTILAFLGTKSGYSRY